MATAALMVSTVEFEAMPRFDFSKSTNRIKVIILLLAAVGVMINASIVIFPLGMLYILYGIGKFLVTILSGNNEKVPQRVSRTAKTEKGEI